jgi:hypothetical protein
MELNILRGILTETQKQAGRAPRGGQQG